MTQESEILKQSVKSLFSFDPTGLTHLPCHLFWKNVEGIYLGYSDYGAISLGFTNAKDIIGSTDLNLFPKETADIFREVDQKVILYKTEIFTQHRVLIKSSSFVTFFSHVIPLYNTCEEVTGILGIAVSINPGFITAESNVSNNYCVTSSSKKSNAGSLSKQEQDCVQRLCRGLSLKEIAREMDLSPRTVETYLERSKIKLNCYKRADLIAKYIRKFYFIF